MTLDQMIARLQQLRSELGNVPVVVNCWEYGESIMVAVNRFDHVDEDDRTRRYSAVGDTSCVVIEYDANRLWS